MYWHVNYKHTAIGRVHTTVCSVVWYSRGREEESKLMSAIKQKAFYNTQIAFQFVCFFSVYV